MLGLLGPHRRGETRSVSRDIQKNSHLYRVSIDIVITVNLFAN